MSKWLFTQELTHYTELQNVTINWQEVQRVIVINPKCVV